MPDFSVEVSRWCDKAGARAQLFLRVYAVELVNRVKELTPVDTGFLRSNWTAIRQGDAEPVPGRVPDPLQGLADVKLGDVVIIINPTVYARRIEYGFVGEDSLGRHYNHQGAHMMTQTVAEASAIADKTLARIGGS